MSTKRVRASLLMAGWAVAVTACSAPVPCTGPECAQGGGGSTLGGGAEGGGSSSGGGASLGGGAEGGGSSSGGGTSLGGGSEGGGSSSGGGTSLGGGSEGGGTASTGGGTASTGGGTASTGGGTASTGGGTASTGGGTASTGGGTASTGGGTASTGGGTASTGGGTASTGGGTASTGGGTASTGGGTASTGGGTASTGGGTASTGGGTASTGGGTASTGGGTASTGGGTASTGGGTASTGGGTASTGGGSGYDAGADAGSDAGRPDAGQPDAGKPDAGQPDAGPPDAGPPDAGPPDAGRPDAGTDSGVALDAGPGVTYRVFASSIYFSGNFKKIANTADGLSGGDELCQLLADAVWLNGTWKAFISVANAPAANRFKTHPGPWYLMGNHGLAFASGAAMGAPPVHPIKYDERGNVVFISPSNPYIGGENWTGTLPDGGVAATTCNSWTSSTAGASTIAYTDSWLSTDVGSCFGYAGLYCFETARTRPDGGTSYPPAGPTKRMFVTSNAYSGNLKALGSAADGLAGGDQLCANAATAANLGGVWKAWLSTSTTRAIDRISSPGPWTMVGGDGGITWPNVPALKLEGPLNPLNRTEFGLVVPPNTWLWTGTETGGGWSGSGCGAWDSASAGANGSLGSTSNSGPQNGWQGGGMFTCNTSRSLLCIEQ